MRYSHWTNGDYPIFINPTDAEIIDLAKPGWDTIRICIDEEKNIFALASGHGNTHQSVIDAVRATKDKRFFGDSYILFKEGGDFWFNLEDVSGKRKAHYLSTIREYFDSEIVQQNLLDLISLS